MCDDLAPIPVGGDVEEASVASHVVVLHGHLGWLAVEMSAPWEADVDIHGVSVPVEFPHPRHAHLPPRGGVIPGREEVGGPLVGVFHPFEVPRAFEGEVVGRGFHIASPCHLLVLVCEERGVWLEAVDVVHLHVVPFGESWCVVGHDGGRCEPCTEQKGDGCFFHIHLMLFQ